MIKSKTRAVLYVNDAVLLNAPDTTLWRRGWGLPAFLATIAALSITDSNIDVRQLYQIAELGLPASIPTSCPAFMRLKAVDAARIDGDDLDFRDQIMAMIYDRRS